MKGIFILSDYKEIITDLSKKLDIPEKQILSFNTFNNESDWHDWTTSLFKENDIQKLIIPISIPTDSPINSMGLMIALHIRLNFELSKDQRLVPLIFLSDFNLENILRTSNFDMDNSPQNLLFTKGVFLSNFDKDQIQKTIEKTETCNPSDYKRLVLNKLNILPKANMGKHSISNAWGCFKLSLVAGLGDVIFKQETVSGMLKTLYAKYLICYNDAYSEMQLIDPYPLRCHQANVLFIDDQGDEGWSELMKHIFTSAGNSFLSIDSSKYKNKETKLFHDFEGFYNECRSQIGKDWDLIIIDLRLNPEKEDMDKGIIAPTEFSGYKLIDEFLNENKGYQIIVSTASNKIWNLNAAIERGISSYYVKESPEFNYTTSDTRKNFDNLKSEVVKCFKRSYLRNIYKSKQELIKNLNGLSYDPNFIEELKNQINLSYSLLLVARSKEQFAYAFVSLYVVIEIINNQFYTKKNDSSWEIEGVGKLYAWSRYERGNYVPYTIKKDKENIEYRINEVTGDKPPEWQKIAGLYFQKWGQSDNNFIYNLNGLIKKRNGFIHNDRSILDKTKLDRQGKEIYLNHDIYESVGFIKLFEHIKKLIEYL